MTSRKARRGASRAEPWLVGVSLLVFAACTAYTVLGLDLPKRQFPWSSSTWVVHADQPGCEDDDVCLRRGDRVLEVGGVSFAEYRASRATSLLDPEDRSGEREVEVLFERDRRVHRAVLDWHREPLASEIEAFVAGVVPYLFWLLGTLCLGLVRPRNTRWLVLTAFYYDLALLLSSGLISPSQQFFSYLVLHAAAFVLVPLMVHLHLIHPNRIFPGLTRWLVPLLWVAAAVAIVLDLGFQLAPSGSIHLAAFGALGFAVATLIYRLLSPQSLPVRAASRVILVGLGLGLLPFVLQIVVTRLTVLDHLGFGIDGLVLAVLVVLLLPNWPASYLWSIHRVDLGRIQLRANRALGTYGFWSAYLALYVVVFLLVAELLPATRDQALATSLGISLAFVVAGSALHARFQRWVDRRIFGIPVSTRQVIQEFAARIPTAFDRESLRRTVMDEVMPSLMIRESALFVFERETPSVLYSQNVAPEGLPAERDDLLALLDAAAEPRNVAKDALPESLGAYGWVRLAIPLVSRRRRLGVWLLGRRDPDDDYPRDDVRVLGGLANQIASVLRVRREVERRRRLQDQLLQSQKMEAIGRLSAGVAHDFNNLLSAILGYSDLLLGGDEDLGPRRSFVEGIRDAGEKAAELTTQLLAFSRRQVVAARVVDLNEVVGHLEKLLRRVLEENIELGIRLDAEPALVRIDPGQMEQVLLNLAVNAGDAMREHPMPDGGRLWISTERLVCLSTPDASTPDASTPDQGSPYTVCHPDVPPGEYVVLRVEDDGAGIDPSVRDRIFEPFFTTKEQGQGTGLGLSMVYGIVSQSRGHIAVDSRTIDEAGEGRGPGLPPELPGAWSARRETGTTISIYLPPAAELGDDAEPPSDAPAAPLAVPALGRRPSPRPRLEVPPPAATEAPADATILVVEDEESVRRVVCEILASRGFHVLEAEDGPSALDLVKEHGESIDLLLTDVMMPTMKGPELADRLATIRPELRVVFMSGYNEEDVLDRRLREGEVTLLRKPFAPEELERQLRRALES